MPREVLAFTLRESFLSHGEDCGLRTDTRQTQETEERPQGDKVAATKEQVVDLSATAGHEAAEVMCSTCVTESTIRGPRTIAQD